MLAAVTAIVRFCARFPWLIIVLGVSAAGISATYAASHFAIDTDVNKLISPNLDWRKREPEFEKAVSRPFRLDFGGRRRADRRVGRAGRRRADATAGGAAKLFIRLRTWRATVLCPQRPVVSARPPTSSA